MSSPSNAARRSSPSLTSIAFRTLNSYSVFAASAAFAVIGLHAEPALAKKDAPREHVPFEVEHGRGASPGAPSGLRFEAFGRRFDLDLEPNTELAAPGLKGWIVDASGRHSVDLPDVWIATSADGTAHGRLSFEDGKPKGWVKSGGETWAIDPDEGAATVAVGSAAELLAAADPILCGSDEVAPGVTLVAPKASSLRGVDPNPRILEVSIIADAAFYRAHVTDSVGEILSILNGVDGIYRDDLGLAIQLVQLVVYRSEAVEPFNPVDHPEDLLYEVGGARNMDPVLSVGNGSVTHLFTGRDFGAAAGIAFVGSVCHDFYGAGLSAVEGTSAYFDVVLVAHEIGHNLGAGHDGQSGSGCEGTGIGYVMWPILNGGVLYEFSPCSIGVIDSTVAGASCLATTTPALCGNGNLDPGEFCDPGAPVVGSCCRVDCTYVEAGVPCGNSGDICLDAVCNGGGACLNEPNNESCPSPSVCEAAQCSGGSCQPVGMPAEFGTVSVSLHSRDGAVDYAKFSVESPLEHLGSSPCDDGVEVEISVGGTPYWSETIAAGSWVCKTNGKSSYRALAPVPGQVKTLRVTYDEGHMVLKVKGKTVAPTASFVAATPTLHLLSGNNADGQCGTNVADVCVVKGANLVCQ